MHFIKMDMKKYIYDAHSEERWVVLNFATCLRILLFLNNSPIVHFCTWRDWEVCKIGHILWASYMHDPYDKINEFSYFKCGLASCINKLRDTAIELVSKYTFFKTWNSHLNNNDSLNYSLISYFFSPWKHLRVTLQKHF